MLRKSVLYLITLVILVSVSFTFAEDPLPPKIIVDGYEVEFNDYIGKPFIDENYRTQVPFRAVMQAFGASVSWDSSNYAAVAIKDGKEVRVPINKNYITIDGVRKSIDTSAIIKDGRTYLPIRAVLEAFDATILWDGETRSVMVESALADENTNETGFTVHIIASKDDMVNGFFKVQFTENLNEDAIRTFNVNEENSNPSNYIEPFIDGDKGQFDYEDGKVTFKLDKDLEGVSYGYIVRPGNTSIGGGILVSDLAILWPRNFVDWYTIEREITRNIPFVIDVPEEYTLMVSFEQTGENTYLSNGSNEDDRLSEMYEGGAIIWGDIEILRKVPHYSNEMVFFKYGDNISDEGTQEIMDYVSKLYSHDMPSTAHATENLYSKQMYFGFVEMGLIKPDGIHSYEANNLIGEMSRSILAIQANDELNFDNFIGGFEHGFTHFMGQEYFRGWWSIEGTAEFKKVYLPGKLGYDHANVDSSLNELKEDINFYNEIIVEQSIDIPPILLSENDPDELIKLYPATSKEEVFPEYLGVYTLSPYDDYIWDYEDQYESETNGYKSRWFVYRKSHMVHYILNEVILHGSEGNYDLTDLYKWVQNNRIYVDEVDLVSTHYKRIEEQITKMSGVDITGFFDKYVFDTNPLPIKVVDDQIVVTEYID